MKKPLALFILAGLIPACTFAEITAPTGDIDGAVSVETAARIAADATKLGTNAVTSTVTDSETEVPSGAAVNAELAEKETKDAVFNAMLAELAVQNSTNPIVAVMFGQSNIGGVSGDVPPYYGNGAIAGCTEVVYDDTGYFPKTVSVTWDNGTAGWSAELEMFQRLRDATGREVVIIRISYGGQAIEVFSPDSETVYRSDAINTYSVLTNSINFAYTNVGVDHVDFALWGQGETPGTNIITTADYKAKEIEIRDSLRTISGCSNMIWITSGLGGPLAGDFARDWYSNIAKQEIASEDTLSRYVDMYDAVGNPATVVHYNGEWRCKWGDRALDQLFVYTKGFSIGSAVGARSLSVQDGISLSNGDITLPDGTSVANRLSTIESGGKISQSNLVWYFDYENPANQFVDNWTNTVAGGGVSNLPWSVGTDGGKLNFATATNDYIQLPWTTSSNFTAVAYLTCTNGFTEYAQVWGSGNFSIKIYGYDVTLVGGNTIWNTSLNDFAYNTPQFFFVRQASTSPSNSVWKLGYGDVTHSVTSTAICTMTTTNTIGSTEAFLSQFKGSIYRMAYFDKTLSDAEIAIIKYDFETRKKSVFGVN
jgi:hypothetical protein